jgi:hypothetical protein
MAQGLPAGITQAALQHLNGPIMAKNFPIVHQPPVPIIFMRENSSFLPGFEAQI